LRVEGNGSLAETIPRYEVTSYFGLARPANLPADAVRLGAATVAPWSRNRRRSRGELNPVGANMLTFQPWRSSRVCTRSGMLLPQLR